MSQIEIICPNCNSKEYKKTFFGGYGKIGAIFLILWGIFLLVSVNSAANSAVVLIIAGTIGLFIKKFKCKKSFG